MRIAAVLANYSMSEADGLRKAMGKKIAEVMAQQRERFITGAIESGYPGHVAETIFNLMEKFGGYGFNKSHSAAYALIAFQTAYLKAHYPVEFMAALLTSEMTSIDGVVKFIAECRRHQIDVLPPDINSSSTEFTVDNGSIRFGLVAVKNVGEGAISSIVETRTEGGGFASLFEFCARVDLRKVNKRVIESLIKCGAFDTTGAPRAAMMAVLEEALEYGQRLQRQQNDPQMGLFDQGDTPLEINMPTMPALTEWDDRQRLSFEKEALGFYITGHPLARHEALMEKYTTTDAVALKETTDKQTVRIGGMIAGTRLLRTKRGDQMAFLSIEDMHGTFEVIVFPEVYAASEAIIVPDAQVLIRGLAQKEENAVKIIAEELIPMERAEALWTTSVHLTIDLKRVQSDQLHDLKKVFATYRGSSKGVLHLLQPQRAEAVIALPDSMRLNAGGDFVRAVESVLGYKAVETTCSSQTHNAL